MTSRMSAAFLSAIALTTLVACGDDDKKATSVTTTPPATTPAAGTGSSSSSSSVSSSSSIEGEYAIVPDAAVTAGFASLQVAMTVTAGLGAAVPSDQLDEIEKLWKGFEGTVKQNEPDSYLQAEEALDAFFDAGKNKDGAGMTAAAAEFKKVADAYLAKHP